MKLIKEYLLKLASSATEIIAEFGSDSYGLIAIAKTYEREALKSR